MSEAKDKKNLTKGVKNDSYLVGFISGACASCMSETITIPLDTAKVRMMLYGMSGKYSSVTSTLKTIAREQGTRMLWKGTIPACQRQCVFSGIKLSLYDPIKNWSCSTPEELQFTPLHKKIFAGVIGGGIACFFASPFDLIKIRMQDVNKSKLYDGVLDCYKKIYMREGGIRGYFKGCGTNIGRNAFMNAAELTGYDTTRQLIMTKTNLPDHPALYILYGAAAGITGALCAQPVDLLKTRVMNNPEIYKNFLTCLKMTVQKDGFLSLYNGIRPFMVRAVSFNTLLFLFYGYLREFFGKAIDGE
ncbi:unnamed protein product [Moneuplotes crassus]|uniref:Uncharacterized protein n=1 Tax=Euplotes crassus TaxID=5936 RepID=A0AAD1XPN2_EUPCR|nr:unnamed protein product [Moneuplotes crassus]